MGNTTRDGARLGLAWLASPLTIAATVLLAVNDHVLKAAMPGLVTGKLSDVAGLVVAPALLAAVALLVVPRLPAGAVAVAALATTAVGFILVKSTTAGAELASSVWTVLSGPSSVRRDLTDLFALPALLLAWYGWRHARRSPVPGQVARLVRMSLVLPAVLMTVAATSQDIAAAPEAVGIARGGEGLVAWQLRPDGSAQPEVVTSPDGVLWRHRTAAFSQSERNELMKQEKQNCAEEVLCYDGRPGELTVLRSGDTVVWHVDNQLRDRMASGAAAVRDNVRDAMACNSVATLEQPGGHVAVASCGLAGLVRRNVDGSWEMVGFPFHVMPSYLTSPSPLRVLTGWQIATLLLLAWLVIVFGTEAYAGAATDDGMRRILAAMPAVLLGVALLALEMIYPYVTGGFLVALALAFAVKWVLNLRAMERPVRPFVLAGLFVFAASVAILIPANRHSYDLGLAWTAVAAVCVVGLGINLIVARLRSPSTPPRPPQSPPMNRTAAFQGGGRSR